MRRLDPIGSRGVGSFGALGRTAARLWRAGGAVVALAAVGSGPPATAGPPGTAGAGPTLAAPVHAVWRGVPLATWTHEATALAGVPVIRDRRLDPELDVDHEAGAATVADVLDAVAAAAGGRVVVLGSTVRLVPADGAGDLVAGERARRAEITRLPQPVQRLVGRREAWAWPAAARPRDLVAAAAAAAGIELEGLETIPHDHLPAASLPPLELGERLDLVLAHYDLRVAWDLRSPAGPSAGPSRATSAGGPPAGLVRAAIVPLPTGDTPPGAAGGRRAPDGRQAAGQRELDRGVADGAGTADPRFTLRLEATLEQAVAALAERFGLVPAIDREALAARGILPGEIVRVDVRDAGRDDLFDAIVAPLGLGWRIEGRRLVVEPRPRGPVP